MISHLFLLLTLAASPTPPGAAVTDHSFATYSTAKKSAAAAKTSTEAGGGSGRQVLKLDVLEAVERLQEQKPKRSSAPQTGRFP